MAQLGLPGGGRTHGALIPHPHYRHDHAADLELAREGYDPRRHGWYDPRGLAETHRLSSQERFEDKDPTHIQCHLGVSQRESNLVAGPASWTWMMNKARNHIGAGVDGIMDSTDVCSTMISGDTPTWMVGLRTVNGPFNCKSVPSRRCPKNWIDGDSQRLLVRSRTYEQGPNMDITEHLSPSDVWHSARCRRSGRHHEAPQAPLDMTDLSGHLIEKRRPRITQPHWMAEFKGHQRDGRAASHPDTLLHGGCQMVPAKHYHSNKVTREHYDPGSPVSAGKLTNRRVLQAMSSDL